MAIKRIGSARMHDDPNNVWNPTLPGDVMHGAPGVYGQELREAPGPVITEAEMAPPAEEGKPVRKRMAPSLPDEAVMEIKTAKKGEIPKIPINLRIPTDLLQKYKKGGPGYQTRMISVLELFFKSGGTFTEV
jgi:uncharacterized protein (DUF4415 family)